MWPGPGLGRRLGLSFLPPSKDTRSRSTPLPPPPEEAQPLPSQSLHTDPLWTLTHLWRDPRVGQPLVPPPTPLRSGAPLPGWAQLAQPRGCPGPRKTLGAIGQRWPMPWDSPPGAASLPPFLPTPLHIVLFMGFQGSTDPRKTTFDLPGQSPKLLGKSQFPLDRRCLFIHLTGQEQSLLWDVRWTFVPPTPNFQGLLLSQLCENEGVMEHVREEGVCPAMHECAWQRLYQQLCVLRLYI